MRLRFGKAPSAPSWCTAAVRMAYGTGRKESTWPAKSVRRSRVCGKERQRERERNTLGTARHPTNDAEWVHHYVLFWPARGSNNRGGATPMLRARQLLLV